VLYKLRLNKAPNQCCLIVIQLSVVESAKLQCTIPRVRGIGNTTLRHMRLFPKLIWYCHIIPGHLPKVMITQVYCSEVTVMSGAGITVSILSNLLVITCSNSQISQVAGNRKILYLHQHSMNKSKVFAIDTL